MAENSKIEWTDHTFNPWTGCTKVSPACDHCYAESWSKRAGAKVGKWGSGAVRVRTTPANWAQPLKWHAQAEREGRRFRVFCSSLADVFDNEVPAEWRHDLFELIAKTPNLDWLLLTKRIGNARAMLAEVVDELSHGINTWDELPWPGVWIGATVCNQAEADRDIPKLLGVPAAVRFLSVEPMLGPVNLDLAGCMNGCGWVTPVPCNNGKDLACPKCKTTVTRLGFGQKHGGLMQQRGIDWVICGGESGSGARPMHPDWARSLRDQCAAACVPFLFKQWGEWIPRGPVSLGYPLIDGVPRIRLTDTGENGSDLGAGGDNHVWMQRAGKKNAGRQLDGLEYSDFPQVSP